MFFDKFGGRILIYLLVVCFVSYIIWFDYFWFERTSRRMMKDGWVVISYDKGHFVLEPSLRPWNIFNQPISHIDFAKKYDIYRVDKDRLIGHINRVSRDGFETNYYETFSIYNCKLNTIKSYETIDELKNNLNKIDKYNAEIKRPEFDYFCSRNISNPYLMTNAFGRDVDISNFIISDLYTIIDSVDNHIFDLKNNNPYLPTEIDEKYIISGFEKWLLKNYNVKSNNLPNNLFELVSYKRSQMGFNMPLDIYTMNIKIDGKKYNPEFWFAKISNPLNSNEPNSVEYIDN